MKTSEELVRLFAEFESRENEPLTPEIARLALAITGASIERRLVMKGASIFAEREMKYNILIARHVMATAPQEIKEALGY
jgi:hypothetical protein